MALLAARRPPEPSPQHLLVAREVVRPLDGLDPEPPVLPRPRPALLEHHHAADRVAALEVRDVVALDPHRRPDEPQRRGELLERAERPALVGQPSGGLARQRLRRVPRGELHQLALLAPLRGADVDAGPTTLGEERLEVGGVGERARDEDLARDAGRPGVVLLEEAAQHLVVADVVVGVEEEHVAAEHLAVAHDEQLHGRLVVLAGERREIQLGPRERGHLLALHRPLDRPDLVADDGGPLVLLRLGGEAHLVAQARDQRVGVALEEQLHLPDVAPVGGLRHRLDARALAALDVVQQAGPRQGAHAVLDVDGAGPEREQAAHEVHRLVHRARRRVRPEVPAAVVGQLAGALDAREVVAQRDLDVRVALVVLEADVEPRAEPLDQVRLEQEGLGDRVDLGDLEVRHPVDGLADLVIPAAAARRLLLPVAANAAAQALGLPDVQHLALRVLHQVHAGPVGQVGEGRGELGGHPPIVRQVRPDGDRRAGRVVLPVVVASRVVAVDVGLRPVHARVVAVEEPEARAAGVLAVHRDHQPPAARRGACRCRRRPSSGRRSSAGRRVPPSRSRRHRGDRRRARPRAARVRRRRRGPGACRRRGSRP